MPVAKPNCSWSWFMEKGESEIIFFALPAPTPLTLIPLRTRLVSRNSFPTFNDQRTFQENQITTKFKAELKFARSF